MQETLHRAIEEHEAGRLDQGEALYRAVLRADPDNCHAHHNLGVLLIQRGLGAIQALPHFRAAWTVDPAHPQHGLSYLRALVLAGDIEEARRVHADGTRRGLALPSIEALQTRRAVEASGTPSQAQTSAGPEADELQALAKAYAQKDFSGLESLARSLTEGYPQHGVGWKAMGVALQHQRRAAEAAAALRQAALLLPDDDETHGALGATSMDLGLWNDAEAEFRRVVALRPDFAYAHCGLGRALSAQARLDEALASYRRALAIEPDHQDAYAGIGATLIRQNRWVEAEAHCREALARNPSRIDAYRDLGAILERQGRLTDAAANYRQALAREPDHLASRSGLLFALHYAGRESPEALLAEAKTYGARAQAKATRPYQVWHCDAAPERLRVGIVSGDLRQHPVGYFLEQVLARSDRDRIQWVAYPTIPETDELSARLRRSLSAWNSLVGLTDEDAAGRIHEDGIHVLIDLSGHTLHGRLPVFAWRPAPVQMTWLGYFATTGLPEMDYVLADRVGLPPHLQSQFTETIRYLPDSRMCFAPPESAPAPAPLPALENGFVTFGCVQAHAKVTDETLHAWSRILASCAGSRLRLQNDSLSDPGVVAALNARLVAQGIDPGRVDLHTPVPRAQYLAAYSEVDLVLDTFPYPGGTTTCEALWMGVPTLTLAGETMIARQGASLLAAAGLSDWVTTSRDEYVTHAIARAGDRPRLSALRRALRDQVRDSPLFDAPRFARNLDDALCGMWAARSRQR